MIFKLLLVLASMICVLAAVSFGQIPADEPGVSLELAKWRAARYSDVRYKLDLTLEKMSPVLKGTIEIRVKVSEPSASAGGTTLEKISTPIILDWRRIRGSESLSSVSNISINGFSVSGSVPPANAGGSDPVASAPRYEERDEHLIFRDGVVAGENVIKLDFTSPILTSGSAITRYVDKEDGAEYIYSLFVPSDASTAFPVFDQPDLKARFELAVETPLDWKVVANNDLNTASSVFTPVPPSNFSTKVTAKRIFVETKPISSYVFAFAAGPFERVSEPPAVAGGLTRSTTNLTETKAASVNPSATHPDLQPPATAGGSDSAIYVRKSQAAKFKPHAAEVFRLNREGIKFLESYFDYKFPFPKYDVVLIPEFPFGGMEHAGATFLRESSVIFPQEPTKNDYISRANVIFHEAAHQWFGDTVTMKWFDDLWLKEGFAEFMAYKTLEKVMPEYNAWKVFYERNKQAAYLTDSTKGTTPIYQEIANLNSAKSAYGNIVYRKAPSFLKQAEFYLGPDKFQTAVRAFLKKHEYANAGWEDLVKELELAIEPSPDDFEGLKAKIDRGSSNELGEWAKQWVTMPGAPTIRVTQLDGGNGCFGYAFSQTGTGGAKGNWAERFKPLVRFADGNKWDGAFTLSREISGRFVCDAFRNPQPVLLFPNYQDYGYGIFLLDPKSRDYVLKNIGSEQDDFLRTMMWGSLWDSVREGELAPKEYVELVVKNLKLETDESTIQTLLGRVSTAMRYYIDAPPASGSEPPALAGGTNSTSKQAKVKPRSRNPGVVPPAYAGGSDKSDLQTRVENLLIDRMQNASTPGQRITYYRSFLNIASSENARRIMKEILKKSAAPGGSKGEPPASAGGQASGAKSPAGNPSSGPPADAGGSPFSTKDKFDIVSRLIILGDPEAPKLLADLEQRETSDEAKRYAYAAKAGFATAENKAKFWNDFVNNKDISESWIEAAFGPFNNVRHSELTLPYLEKALAELPNLKRSRKIFFVNGWLGAFIGGQKSEAALKIVNDFLAKNPGLDKDLRLKILENVDVIERAVKIRAKY